jgi:hypothetical protein
MNLPFLSRGISFIIDNTPDAFSFATSSGVTKNAVCYSNIVQITGINVPVTASATAGAKLQVSSDAAGNNVVQSWASNVTVQLGQYLRVQLTAGGWNSTTTATISVGLGTATYSVVTQAESGGTWNYGAGTYDVTIPNYNTLTATIWGAGGGGGGSSDYQGGINSYFGGQGGTSYFSTPGGVLYAYGGAGGGNSAGANSSGANGGPGSASGGNLQDVTGGGEPGGAGSQFYTYNVYGGTGGPGGLVQSQWQYGQAGAPVPGQTYTLVVAGGGAGGYGNTSYGNGGANAAGQISWS